jgi:Tfp pilus assembly protein PilX
MKRTLHQRGGIALVLVVVVMAAAAIMGFALLSSASIQADASRNSVSSFSADGLAESGSTLAEYYLMNPDKAATSAMSTNGSTTFYNPGSSVPSMNPVNGATLSKIAVSLSSRAGTLSAYGIDVTANSGSLSTSLTRTMHSNVQLQSRYLVKYAMASNDAFTVPMSGVTVSIGGNVRSDNGIGGLLSAILGSVIIPQNTAKPTYPAAAVPSYSQLDICKSLPAYPTTTGTGTAQLVSGSISSFPAANGTNPDAVYYSNGSLTLANGTFNGTLIVKSGSNLNINGNAVFINSKKTGQPALVVGKDLVFTGVLLNTRALTVNGLCWLGGNMTSSGVATADQFTVNGALMWGGSNPKIDTTGLLTTSYVHVNWPTSANDTQTKDSPNWDLLYVPTLCDEGLTPKTIKLLSTSIH